MNRIESKKPSSSLPRRSKLYGVGKAIGGAVYVHRTYENVLGEVVENAKAHLPDDFKYAVVKLHEASRTVSFAESSDFDTAPEPTVGDVVTVKPDGTARCRKQLDDPYIYHHKWLFVSDDYVGFDVEQSKRRSLHWLSLPGIDRSRIGRRSYWSEHVAPLLREKHCRSAGSKPSASSRAAQK